MKASLMKQTSRQRGFTLIELLITTVILVTIFGVITRAIVNLQRRNSNETSKTDMTQQARDFIDQSVRDIHQAGYPPTRSVSGAVSTDQEVAAGVIKIDQYFLQFEADTDGSGTVNEEIVELIDSKGNIGGATCPCTIQRGVVAKPVVATGALNAVPTFFTQLGGVTNTTSATAVPLFRYFKADGTEITTLPVDNTTVAGQQTITSVRSIKMTVNTQSPNVDLDTKVAPTLSLTSEAKVANQ
jgi:prepilin-type N-terminal cleavage/methylation domain-containing protein